MFRKNPLLSSASPGRTQSPLVLRALCAWCAAASVVALKADAAVSSLEAYHAFGLAPAAIVFFSALVLLSAVCDFTPRHGAAVVLLPPCFGLYTFLLLRREDDPWFLFAFACLWAVLFFYYAKKRLLPPLPAYSPRLLKGILVMLIVVFFAVTGALGVLRYRTFSTPNYDFGIFSQIFYYLRTTLQPLSTCERDRLLSHFAVHLSPVLYLLLPVYFVFPFPETIQLSQALILASAAIPLFFLAKRLRLSDGKALIVSALLLLHPAVGYSVNYDFHENCFLLPLLLWMFFFYEKRRPELTFAFACLTLLVKEDAAVYVVFFALFVFFDRKDYKTALLLGGTAVGYFAVALLFLSVSGEGVMSYRYENFITADGGLFEAAENVLLSPGFVFTQLLRDGEDVSPDKLLFFLQLFAPLCFLPLCCKKVSRLTLLFPALLLNFMTAYGYQFRIGFQYAFGSAAFLFYLTLLNLSDLSKETLKAALSTALAVSLMCFYSTVCKKTAAEWKDAAENAAVYEKMRETVRRIPADASVAASTFLCPQLSQRKALYESCYHEMGEDAPLDYVLLDLRYDHAEELNAFLDAGYEPIETVEADGEPLILILRK